jgi:hypothetical protein
MNMSLNRGRAASASTNRGRGRGRGKPGTNSTFTPFSNGQATDFHNTWTNQKSQQGKRGGSQKRNNRQINAMNHSLDELLPGSDDEIISLSRGKGQQTLDERAARFSAHANAKNVQYEEVRWCNHEE